MTRQDFTYYVYLLASGKCGYMYVGITEDLLRRIHEHKTKRDAQSHTSRHSITNLVYFEVFNDVMLAIQREKKLKKWRRNWKFALVEQNNPTWQCLHTNLKGLNE